MDTAGTATVTLTVTDVARLEGPGRLAASAAIGIELDGVASTVRGIRVLRQTGRITTEAPRSRDRGPESGCRR